MFFRQPVPPASGVRRALLRLILSLTAVLLGASAPAARLPKQPKALVSQPYLPVTDAPGLRFREAVAPVDLGTRPAYGAPPVVEPTPEATEVATANNAAVVSTPPFPAGTVQEPEKEATAKIEEKPKPAAAPSAILPDDTRPKARSEDFLPFFKFPGGGASPDDVTVIMPGVPTPPAPGSLPTSSATYRQQ